MPLEPISNDPRLEERVLAQIRAAIVSGDLRPGDRISQDEIARQLQVSRMPIRAALARLQEQQFVVVYPHRGAVVAPVSLEDLREAYLIRAELEALAARLAAPNLTREQLRDLEAILADAKAALEAKDAARLVDLNRDFHRLGYEASGRRRLCDLIDANRDHADRYRRLHAMLWDRSKVAYSERRKILAAWKRRDAEAAAHWVRVNLEHTRDAVLAAVEERGAAELGRAFG